MSHGEDGEKRVAISGASGLVGSALGEHLRRQGWSVEPLVRDREDDGIYWSVAEQALDVEGLEGVDAVVHLAGKNINDGRWSDEHKRQILESRVRGTELLAGAVAELSDPPESFVCASAVGYYGPRGDEWVDETNESGEGFLPKVCRRWEAASKRAGEVCRVANTRFGMVLTAEGGALAEMLTPFKFGVGGRIGDGEQYMSWIAETDVVRAIEFVIDGELEGPVNVVSPEPVKNKVFTKALGRALGRPTFLPVPTPALKLLAGAELAEALLLSGQRVRPAKLLDAGFEFEYPDIDQALEAALG